MGTFNLRFIWFRVVVRLTVCLSKPFFAGTHGGIKLKTAYRGFLGRLPLGAMKKSNF